MKWKAEQTEVESQKFEIVKILFFHNIIYMYYIYIKYCTTMGEKY